MSTHSKKFAAAAFTGLAIAFIAVPQAAFAQTKGGPKIVCWKDKSGKVIGCGDTVPPEYRDNATKELDKQGMTRKTGESAAEADARRAQEQARTKEKADEERRVAEQKRKDNTLLNIYTNEKEIDLKRDRELKIADQGITQQQAALKLADERLADAKKRNAQNEIARAESSKSSIAKDIAAREANKKDLTQRYADEKKRYMELKGIPQPAASAPATAPAATPAPATPAAPSAAPAKK